MHQILDNGETLSIHTPRAFLPLLDPRPYKGASGGRSGAKSHFFCESLIEDCLRMHVRAACIREFQLSLKESVKQTIEDKIRAMGLSSAFRIVENEITGPNDSLMIFKGVQSHTAQRLKSLEGFNRCYVEEAQSMSQRSIDDLMPTFREEDSEAWFAWNPIKSKTDPVNILFTDAGQGMLDTPGMGDPDFVRIHVDYRDNPWLPEKSRNDIERMKRRDPEKYRHIYLGHDRSMSEARIFKNWREEYFETPDDADFYFGADWGYSIDPSVLVRMFIEGRTLYIDREAYMVGCEIDYCPFLFGGMYDKELQEMNAEAYAVLKKKNVQWPGIEGARKWKITADNARPETIAYMKRHGFLMMEPSIKGAGSLEEGIEFLQSYDIVVHPHCRHTIDELTFYSWKIDPRTEEILPVPADKKNHVIDSTRYGVERVRRKRDWRAL